MCTLLATTEFLLDIETSGLIPDKHCIHSIGVGFFTLDGKWQTQSFQIETCEEEKEEKRILKAFLAFCAPYERVYTFYGSRFELPFLKARLKQHHLPDEALLRLKHTDTQKLLSHFGKGRAVIEKNLGWIRQTHLTGKELVKLYLSFTTLQNPHAKTLILNHQKDELESLLLFCEVVKLLYHLLDFQFKSEQLEASFLLLTYTLPFSCPYTVSLETPLAHLGVKAPSSQLQIKLPLFKGRFKRYLSPYKAYVYVINQEQIMPKTLAKFLPKKAYRPATKEECCIYEEGLFCPLLTQHADEQTVYYDPEQKPYWKYPLKSLPSLYKQLFHFYFRSI